MDFHPWEKPLIAQVKWWYFLKCVWHRQSIPDTSLAFRADVSDHWINAKRSLFSFQGFLGKIFWDYGC